MAIVQFTDPVGARAAFKALAYRRMGNSIMYLEKGPQGLFDGNPKVKPVPLAFALAVTTSTPPTAGSTVATPGDEAVSKVAAPNGTLFIKNLNFTTTTALLTSTFSHLPSFAFARVQTKPNPNRPGQKQSMGFGFVGFATAEAAMAAKEAMDGFRLEDHSLQVGFAKRGVEEDDMEGSKKDTVGKKGWRETTTKMVVKNIPFEATKQDIRELFTFVLSRSLLVFLSSSETTKSLWCPFFFSFFFFFNQSVRPSQVRSITQKIQRSRPGVRFPRFLFAARG